VDGISFAGAYVDFTTNNDVYLRLDGSHTLFPGWKTPGTATCVVAPYASASVLPDKEASITCPDGGPGPCGPGTASASNARWKSPVPIDQSAVPAWYQSPPTYPSPSGANPGCTFVNTSSDW